MRRPAPKWWSDTRNTRSQTQRGTQLGPRLGFGRRWTMGRQVEEGVTIADSVLER